KRPATRTWPEPTILPSMVRSEAMTDSFMSTRCSLAGRRGISGVSGAMLLFSGCGAGDGALPKLGEAPAEGVAVPVFVSFQSAMRWPPIRVDERGTSKGTRRRVQEPVSLHADKRPSSPGRRRERRRTGDERSSAVLRSCGLRTAPYSFEKYVKISTLGDERACTPPLGLTSDLLAEGDPAEDDDPQRRQRLSQFLDQGQAAAPLQHEIQDDDIGLRAPRCRHNPARLGHLSHAPHVRLGIDELAHDVAEIPVVLRDEHSQWAYLFLQRVSLPMDLASRAPSKSHTRHRQIHFANFSAHRPPQASISRSNSSVFSRISGSLPRLSTFSRTSGSVLEPRRLNRHCANSIESPSVRSTPSASRSYCCRALLRIDFASDFRCRLISPLIGKSRMRSPTSCDSGPHSAITCSTMSQGIMPLSQ